MARFVRNAVWWIRDYAYAAAWQIRAFASRRVPEDYPEGNGRPVVALPGIWETWAFLRPILDPLHRCGHPIHVIPGLGLNGRPIDRTAKDVAAYLADQLGVKVEVVDVGTDPAGALSSNKVDVVLGVAAVAVVGAGVEGVGSASAAGFSCVVVLCGSSAEGS